MVSKFLGKAAASDLCDDGFLVCSVDRSGVPFWAECVAGTTSRRGLSLTLWWFPLIGPLGEMVGSKRFGFVRRYTEHLVSILFWGVGGSIGDPQP